MLRTGILLPRSTLLPSLGIDFLNALKENLKQRSVFDEIKLLIDNIGFGINEPEIYSKAEKMILEEDADIVILFAEPRISEMLQPLFAATNKILLVVNLGANFPDSWQPSSTTVTHSLNFAMHAELTGKLAAGETNKEAINTISYYDGGYKQCYSMLSGHQLSGGIPAYNHITHIKLEEFTLEPVFAFLEEHKEVNTLLCLFTGDHAERFYKEVSPLQKKYNLNLYVSPMMFEASLKRSLGEDFTIDGVKGYVPWHGSVNNEANKIFIEALASNNKPVNYFSLLGWETGIIISAIHDQYISGNTDAEGVVRSLSGVSFDSPRGWLKVDAETQYTYGPAYLASYKGNMEITLTEPEDTTSTWKDFSKQNMGTGERSSWRNTYLCI